jgi:hypothetical protein
LCHKIRKIEVWVYYRKRRGRKAHKEIRISSRNEGLCSLIGNVRGQRTYGEIKDERTYEENVKF